MPDTTEGGVNETGGIFVILFVVRSGFPEFVLLSTFDTSVAVLSPAYLTISMLDVLVTVLFQWTLLIK